MVGRVGVTAVADNAGVGVRLFPKIFEVGIFHRFQEGFVDLKERGPDGNTGRLSLQIDRTRGERKQSGGGSDNRRRVC